MEIPPENPSSRARLRRAGGAFGALVAVYVGLQGFVALPAVRAWARGRAEDALRGRVGEVALGEVRFDPLFRVVAGPLALGGTPGRPAVTVDRLRLRAAPLALLAGRLEPASLRLHGVRVDASRPDALRLLARRRSPAPAARTEGAEPPARRARAWPRVHVRGLRVALVAGGAEVEAGPWDLDVLPGPGAVHAVARLPAGGRVALDLATASGDGGRVTLALRATGLRPAALGAALGALPLRIPSGAVAVELDLEAPADLASASGRFQLGVDDLAVSAARLGPEPVGPFRLALSGLLGWEARERRATLREGRLAIGSALSVALSGEVRAAGEPALALVVEATRVPYSAFAASLPPALAPPEGAPRPTGDLDARLRVEGPLRDPGDWTLRASLDLSRMRAASRRALPVALRGPFRFQPEGGVAFVVGPENPDFVPVADLPEHVVRAVTTSEDAGFFGHAGFDFEELSIAMQEGLEAGRVVRGGSTITQQVAKNLWLSRDKVLARKVREALGAVALEATLPKARILEIYLNVAEWGPGVFGLGPAAHHWFGKDARLLTPKEAALLAAVIPNPVRFDGVRTQGALGEYFEQRVSELLLKLSTHGVLSHEELLRALEEPLAFAGATPAEEPPAVTPPEGR